MPAPTNTTAKLDRIEDKLDMVSDQVTRLVEQSSQRQKTIDDHESRLRLVERCLDTLTSRLTILTGVAAFLGVSAGSYLIVEALKVVFP